MQLNTSSPCVCVCGGGVCVWGEVFFLRHKWAWPHSFEGQILAQGSLGKGI